MQGDFSKINNQIVLNEKYHQFSQLETLLN
jgi:hypothetical protein